MVISTPLKIPDWIFLLQIYFLAVLVIPVTAKKEPIELARIEAREKFYQCIEDGKEISAAIRLFKQISQTNGKYEGIWNLRPQNQLIGVGRQAKSQSKITWRGLASGLSSPSAPCF